MFSTLQFSKYFSHTLSPWILTIALWEYSSVPRWQKDKRFPRFHKQMYIHTMPFPQESWRALLGVFLCMQSSLWLGKCEIENGNLDSVQWYNLRIYSMFASETREQYHFWKLNSYCLEWSNLVFHFEYVNASLWRRDMWYHFWDWFSHLLHEELSLHKH